MDDAKIELIKLVCAIVFLLLQVWMMDSHGSMEARFWNAILQVSHRFAYAFGRLALEAETNYYASVGAF